MYCGNVRPFQFYKADRLPVKLVKLFVNWKEDEDQGI